MWSEATGIAHFAMANIYMGRQIADVTDAGFVYYDGHNFKVYGKSPSVGVSSDQYAGIELGEAMRDGKLRLVEIPGQEENSYAVTKGTGVPVARVEDLYESRVMLEE